MEELAVFWFRRDLRLEDNAGLWHALTSGYRVLPVFIYDTGILSTLEPDDRRITFIDSILFNLNRAVKERGSSLHVYSGKPLEIFKVLTAKFNIKALYFNRDYEPYALKRDREVTEYLNGRNIKCFSYKDQVIFEMSEVLKNDGKPYTVYTPYSVKWLSLFRPEMIKEYNSARLTGNFIFTNGESFIRPYSLGFTLPATTLKKIVLDRESIIKYSARRDFPAMDGTSNLSPHLRFGTISIREVLRKTTGVSDVFVKELIWREFFMQILYNFPFVTERSFRPEFDRIEWVNDEESFEAWRKGMTGFPIIDAGMRELEATGYMHNRVRMIVANFLTRHLLTDWRWGEAWFAEKLLDFELSSNNGNWQWAAGSGCDAAQYFRIFNPDTQLQKFDPKLDYVKKWVPEINTPAYTKRLVDLTEVRNRALEVYKRGISN
ncbi:MAG: deoxyribodipyrimidine photo-lyase [Bacteroidales bacterium]